MPCAVLRNTYFMVINQSCCIILLSKFIIEYDLHSFRKKIWMQMVISSHIKKQSEVRTTLARSVNAKRDIFLSIPGRNKTVRQHWFHSQTVSTAHSLLGAGAGNDIMSSLLSIGVVSENERCKMLMSKSPVFSLSVLTG